MTIDDVKTKFALIKKDISDVSNDLFIYWCDQINKYLRNEIAKTDPERFITTQTYSVTSEYQTSALPSDFKFMQVDGCGLFVIDDETGQDRGELPLIMHGQNVRGYRIEGGNVVFVNCNNSNFTMRYVADPTTLTSLSDTLIVPDEYMDLMIQSVDVFYNQWDEQAGAESVADFRKSRAISSMLSQIKKDAPVYLVQDFTQYY